MRGKGYILKRKTRTVKVDCVKDDGTLVLITYPESPTPLSFHNLVLPSCLFQTSFLFLMFLFFLIALSGLFPLDPSSILPVQCNAMGHSSFLLTSLFFLFLTVFHSSVMFYLVVHYIAKRFCIEKKIQNYYFFYSSM